MSTVRIDPYKMGSAGAKALGRHTGVLRATPKQVARHGTFGTIINWGNSERRFPNATYINDPEAVTIASDKLLTARRFGESYVSQPEYTTDARCAEGWLSEGERVFSRTLLRASCARGLILCDNDYEDGSLPGPSGNTVDTGRNDGQQLSDGYSIGDSNGRARGLVRAPLYTKYVKKTEEYRIHVFDGQVIDVQQKRKRQEVPNEEVDYQIRNSDNGWVYCRDGVIAPELCLRTACHAVAALDLTFGAVDIGYNHNRELGYVYEVNTAPGLEGTTLDRYRDAFRTLLPQLQSGAFARRAGRRTA